MSIHSPESLNDSAMDDSFDKSQAPRKRSKVSRACDACRRKKVRCDADYLPTLQKVTKVCTNCTKNNETCLFSRVPLKRGPSKGYIRDLVDRMDARDDLAPDSLHLADDSRPRLKSVDVPGYAAPNRSGAFAMPSRIATPQSPASLVKPVLHRLKFSSTSQATLPIILPPLLGAQPLNQPIKLHIPVSKGLMPISPETVNSSEKLAVELSKSRIQGPLWKVPYEMPTSNSPVFSSATPAGSGGLDFNSRRSSVDSISSILTTGSRSRLPSLQPLVSVNSDNALSSTDMEDFASARSGTSSPRHSISSMLSLNGRVLKQLNISAPGHAGYPHYQVQPHPFGLGAAPQSIPVPPVQPQSISHAQSVPIYQFPPLQSPHSTLQQNLPLPYPIPLNLLEYNLHKYYSRFHDSFPILPHDRTIVPRYIAELQTNPLDSEVAIIFNAALNNLINYQLVNLDLMTSLLRRFLDIYPFKSYGNGIKSSILVISFASLVLISYSILLKGEEYSLGISVTLGVFKDFRVLEGYKNFLSIQRSDVTSDDEPLYLARLYLCLHILENCQALTFGTQSLMSHDFDVYNGLVKHFPKKMMELSFVANLNLAKIAHVLVNDKSKRFFTSSRSLKISQELSKIPQVPAEANFTLRFGTLLRDKYELFDFLGEVEYYLQTASSDSFGGEDFNDHIHDYQLKTSRLVKKMSQSLLNFANYVSSVYLQGKSTTATSNSNLSNPFFNMSYGQAFKLVKLCKSLIDSLIQHSGDSEIVSRCMKISNDLSIAFHLLVSILNNLSNLIGNAKNVISTQMKSGNSTSLYMPSDYLDMSGLGDVSILTLLKKLDMYQLNFNKDISREELKASDTTNIHAWKREQLQLANSLIHSEETSGWL